MAGDERNASTVGAVARGATVPIAVLHDDAYAPGSDVHLSQSKAVADALFLVRIKRKDKAFAICRDVKLQRVGVSTSELKVRAFKQIAHLSRAHVQCMQTGHTAHGQVVIPVAVLRFAGGVTGFFAGLEFFEFFCLCLGGGSARAAGAQIRPDPTDEHEMLAVRAPSKRTDTRGDRGDAARFAPIGRNHIKLRFVVFAALLFALGSKCNQIALWAPLWLPVLVTGSG